MSDLKFPCPHCQQHLECDAQLSGRQVQCPRCQVVIRIPPVPGNTAGYKPESGQTWQTFVSSGQAQPVKGLALQKEMNPGKASES